MKRLILLVGARGSGKSTQLSKLHKDGYTIILASTTRRKRSEVVRDHYKYISKDQWQNLNFAWQTEVSGEKYGVEETELEKIHNGEIAVSLFHWSLFDNVQEISNKYSIDLITIGLHTLQSTDDQVKRVAGDQTRISTPTDFQKELESIKRNSSILLKGDETTIYKAIRSVSNLVAGKGMLPAQDIENLINAGSLLMNTENSCIEPASYDLRLGEEVYLNGKRINLSQNNRHFSIPPYSYAVVGFQEKAILPTFVAARYDTTVNLFFNGVILSNGPQVDPGYSGSLYCALFNSSSSPIALSRYDHVATIEFASLATCTKHYSGHYQDTGSIEDYIDKHIHNKTQVTITSRMDMLESEGQSIKKSINRNILKAILALLGVATYITYSLAKFAADMEKMESVKNEIENIIPSLESAKIELVKATLANSLNITQTPTPTPTVQASKPSAKPVEKKPEQPIRETHIQTNKMGQP